MKSRHALIVFLGLLGPTMVQEASADDDAKAWLARINAAHSKYNYSGIFIYRHGDQLEAMRVSHRVAGHSHRERLISLNGAPREIIRDGRRVVCYLPDRNIVLVEHRKSGGQGFPDIISGSPARIEANYHLRLGGVVRVAERMAQLVIIMPRDEMRYGYRLWADRKTGLMLKSSLINASGQVVEQYMFTQIEIGRPVLMSAVMPRTDGRGMVWYRSSAEESSSALKPRFHATSLPHGYRLETRMVRQGSKPRTVVEHHVYSDGLASVSAFIEPLGHKTTQSGPAWMGAVHAYRHISGSYLVTVVGEAPAQTVRHIAEAIRPAERDEK